MQNLEGKKRRYQTFKDYSIINECLHVLFLDYQCWKNLNEYPTSDSQTVQTILIEGNWYSINKSSF